MISNLLLEAALRSALLGLTVWVGLRAFAVRNVLAQKAAWGLVLISALLMPFVLPAAAHVPGVVIPSALIRSFLTQIPQPSRAPQVLIAVPHSSSILADPTALDDSPFTDARAVVHPQSQSQSATPTTAQEFHPTSTSAISRTLTDAPPLPARPEFSLLQIAGFLYLAVAAVLLLRLFYGLVLAVDVWRSATPVQLDSSDLARGLPLRASDSVSSPVTIGSAVVLPANYREWDPEKLRIVLAHERSHVRQGDFYLQLLAGVYAAVAWFSPLGWWLKRKLSDLAEAISDRAGLEQAADRTSYAQVLLEFAAAPRPTVIGVAMARNGSLSRRIERLLNDASFRQAFAGTRRSLATVLIIPVALLAASTLVRVQAAGQAPAPPVPPTPAAAPDPGVVAPQPPPAPATPPAGIATPEPPLMPVETPEIAPAPPEFPSGPIAPQVAPAPPAAPAAPSSLIIAPVAPRAGRLMLITPRAPGSVAQGMVLPKVSSGIVVRPMVMYAPHVAGDGAGHGIGAGQSSSAQSGSAEESENGKRSGYRYSYSSQGDSFAIVRGDNQTMSFNGNIHSFDVDKARKQAHGDFLWFEHDGKSYFIDDPGTLAQIEAMYKPMEDLGRQQEELGKKQEALGKQQEELGKQQQEASVPTPDMSKQIAEIDKAMAKLKANQGKNMNQEEFADMQEKLAELQSRLGEMQAEIGNRQGEFGARMGELGGKMGALGEQMGRIGEEQGRIAQEADRKVKSIIDESLRNGKAHPVQ